MRLILAALACAAALAAAVTCDNGLGILSPSDSRVCCAASCKGCGGAGCDQLPGGDIKCCGSKILAANKDCAAAGVSPPCVIKSTGPTGSPCDGGLGILSASDSRVCCPKSCGGCGGSTCFSFPGGDTACCGSKILAANKDCAAPGVNPPCVVKTGTQTSACKVGVQNGNYCCAKACKQCGGSGCGVAIPGDPKADLKCCTSKITQLCSATGGVGPCLIKTSNPSPTLIERFPALETPAAGEVCTGDAGSPVCKATEELCWPEQDTYFDAALLTATTSYEDYAYNTYNILHAKCPGAGTQTCCYKFISWATVVIPNASDDAKAAVAHFAQRAYRAGIPVRVNGHFDYTVPACGSVPGTSCAKACSGSTGTKHYYPGLCSNTKEVCCQSTNAPFVQANRAFSDKQFGQMFRDGPGDQFDSVFGDINCANLGGKCTPSGVCAAPLKPLQGFAATLDCDQFGQTTACCGTMETLFNRSNVVVVDIAAALAGAFIPKTVNPADRLEYRLASELVTVLTALKVPFDSFARGPVYKGKAGSTKRPNKRPKAFKGFF